MEIGHATVQYAQGGMASSVPATQGFIQPHPQQNISGHLDGVEIRIKTLFEVCETLQERLGPILGPILGPATSEGVDSLVAASPPRSAVADRLIGLCGSLEDLESRLRLLIQRAEV